MISKFTWLVFSLADNMNTKYFMFCLVNFMSFVNIHLSCHSDLQTHSKKVGTVKHLPLCNVAIPFTTLKRRLRDWRHQVMKRFRCNFVPFFLQTSLKVGNSTGSSLSHFCASKCATHSLLETGRDYRQASQVPVPSSSASRTL